MSIVNEYNSTLLKESKIHNIPLQRRVAKTRETSGDIKKKGRKKERPNDLVDTINRGVAPKIKLATSTSYIYIHIHIYKVAQRDMQAIDFSSIGLSLVYFDSSVWRNKFKRGDASNPFRGCARFPRRAPVEIKAQLRRRLRGHPSTRATIEQSYGRVPCNRCVFIFFFFFSRTRSPSCLSLTPVVISGPGCAKTRSNAHPSPSILFFSFLALFSWIFYFTFSFIVEIDFCIAFFFTDPLLASR